MKISIVMAYYNRRDLLINTLNSILFFNEGKDDLEIIIVDDASQYDNEISDIPNIYSKLFIKVIVIKQKNKTWVNPCVPFNIGFHNATGDVIIIQNPECFHLFDIVAYVRNNIIKNKYFVFGCYALGRTKTCVLKNILFDKDKYIERITNAVGNINYVRYDLDKTVSDARERCGWYQHTKYRPDCLHHCSAMTKLDLDELCGFDERFANGIGKDDREFLIRIKRKGMEVIAIDDLYTIHQFHNLVSYSNSNKPFLIKMKKEKGFNSKKNDYYFRGVDGK